MIEALDLHPGLHPDRLSMLFDSDLMLYLLLRSCCHFIAGVLGHGSYATVHWMILHASQ